MPATANVGLAATANFNSQLTSTQFANVAIRLAGDVNLDGHVDAADIGAMMQALTDTATYQSTNNLSSTDATLVLDANGDGVVTNADLQFLLNRLLAGGGSTSNENTLTNSVDANAPPAPTLIQSPQIISAAADETVATANDSASSFTPADETVHFIPLTVTTDNTVSASTSSPANHPSTIANAPSPKNFSLATVDTYFARFDQSAACPANRIHLRQPIIKPPTIVSPNRRSNRCSRPGTNHPIAPANFAAFPISREQLPILQRLITASRTDSISP